MFEHTHIDCRCCSNPEDRFKERRGIRTEYADSLMAMLLHEVRKSFRSVCRLPVRSLKHPAVTCDMVDCFGLFNAVLEFHSRKETCHRLPQVRLRQLWEGRVLATECEYCGDVRILRLLDGMMGRVALQVWISETLDQTLPYMDHNHSNISRHLRHVAMLSTHARLAISSVSRFDSSAKRGWQCVTDDRRLFKFR